MSIEFKNTHKIKPNVILVSYRTYNYFYGELHVDNYTETVEYKLQVKIRDKQTNKVNEADKSDIFARIVNIHRLVNTLVGSEFITTMRKFITI